MATGVAVCLGWLAAIWFPSAELTLSGVSLVVALVMVVLAIVAIIAAVHGHAAVLLVVFFASFFPVGSYLLTLEHAIRWIGVIDLGYLAAGLALWRHGRAQRLRAGASSEQ